jgi:hypothetical protein
MRLKQLARAGLKSVSRGYGSAGAFGHREFTGRGKDWNREAGARYDNSIVYALLMFAWNAIAEVGFFVARPKGDGWEEIPNHPIAQLLEDPNPWYDGATYLGGCILSELAGPGYSCSYKHRSSAGKLIGLEYLPHFHIWPFTNPGSPNFIDYYQLSVPGGYARIDPRNVLQQRYGFVNPVRPQTSVGPLLAALQEVVTDKEAANYTAAMLENVGVTPHLISPSGKDEDGEIIFGSDQAEQIKQRFEESITGDNRGRPLVFPLPVNVQKLSFNPSEMNMEAIRNLNEERICAVMSIHPLAVYLGSALEQSNNRASADAAFRQTARSFTKPYGVKKAIQLTRDLIPELGEPGERVMFRHEAIEALQEDKTETARRDETECRTYKTVNEKRAEKGLPPIPGGDSINSRQAKNSDPDEPDQDDSSR